MQVPYYDFLENRKDVDHHLLSLQEKFYFRKIKESAEHHGVRISECLNKWLKEQGLDSQTSEFVDKIC